MWVAIGGILGLLVLIIWVASIYDIIRSAALSRGQKAAWILIVLILPFIGSALYWALRKPSQDDVEHQFEAERSLRDSRHARDFDSTGIGP
jgi:hypothetical protein